MKGDLIETYKILTGLDRVDSGRMFPVVGESRTRGHSLRIRGKPFRTEVRRNLFTEGGECVEFTSTDSSSGQNVV